MHLIQILLPLYNSEREGFSPKYFVDIRNTLTERYGGITTYTRSPASGLWKEEEGKTVKDDIVIYEVMTKELDRSWWKSFKTDLEHLFEQDEIMIRTWDAELL